MSLRTTLPEKSKFNNTASIVKMPEELDVEVELILNDDGSYNFKIPFLVDMREAIKKKAKLIVEITDGSNPEPMGIVDINTRSIDTKTLDKLNMLPGQENNNSGFVKRMKARNEEKELGLSATKSGKVMSGKSSFESSKRSINLLGQNNDIGDAKDRLIKKSLLLHSVSNSKKLRYDKLTTNKTKIKKRYQIDYTSNISNEVVLNIDNLSDLQAFGLKDMYYLGYPDNPGHDATSRIAFSPRSLPTVSAPKVSIGSSIQNSVSIKEKPKTARKSINQLYIKGIDPAASFEGLQTHRSPKNIKRGTKPRIPKSYFSKKLPILGRVKKAAPLKMSLLNSQFSDPTVISEGNAPGTFAISTKKSPEDYPFVYVKKEINRFRLVYFNYKLENSHKTKNKVHMVMRIVDDKGMNLFRKRFDLNYPEIIQKQITVPKGFPSLSISRNRKGPVTAKIINPLPYNIGYKIFRKIMTPGKSALDIKFDKTLEGTLNSGKTARKRLEKQPKLSTMFRMTYSFNYGGESINYANYVDDFLTIPDKNRSSRDLNIFALSRDSENAIQIEVTKIPDDVVAMRIMKRDSSIKSKGVFEYLKDGKSNQVQTAKKVRLGGQKTMIFVDLNVKDGRKYEYLVEMTLDTGLKIKSRKKFSILYQKRERSIRTSVDESSLDLKRKRYSFKVNHTKEKSATDKLLDSLTEKEFEIFKSELQSINQTAKTTVRSKVTIFNLTEGTSRHIGDYLSGDVVFIDRLSSNCNYVYRIEPYEYSPVMLIDKIVSIYSKAKNLQADSMQANGKFGAARRAALTNIKRAGQKTEIKKRRSKFFNKRTMKRGTLVPDFKSFKSTSGDPGIEEMTGDIFYGRFSTFGASQSDQPQQFFDARQKDIYVLPDHRVKLEFDIIGNLDQVDFMIISAKKNGGFFPVGPAHCDSESNSVCFVDYTNVDFLGKVDYYVQPVFESGAIGSKVFIGSAALVNSY